MGNPLVNNINMDYIKNIYQAITTSQNPQQLFMQMAQNNPQLQPVVQAMRHGMNPQDIFYNMCKQRGINPQEFISNITGNNTNSR